jgi:DNA-binding transcriptional LysR family regulator
MQTFDLLDWNDIKVFLATARSGSLAAAAKRLKIDQSTVSRRLANLESALGLALFERLPSGLRLSEVGQRLLGHAEQVESAIISLQQEDHPGDGLIGGRVRLATMEGIASLYLAERLGRLREHHPDLMIDLVTSAQTVYVNRREADLFLSFFKPPGKGLISEQIGVFRLGLYAASLCLLRRGSYSGRLRPVAGRPARRAPNGVPLHQYDRAEERRARRPRPRSPTELRGVCP